MFNTLSPASKVFFSLSVLVVSGMILYFLGSLLAIPLFGVNIFSEPEALTQIGEENLPLLRYFQIVNSLGLFVIPPFIIAWLFNGSISEGLSFNRRISVFSIILVVLSILVSQPLVNGLSVLNSMVKIPESLAGLEVWLNDKEDLAREITVVFLQMNNSSDFLINLVMIGLIPAIGEELVFRATYQRMLADWFKNAHVAIWVTSFFFSALHLQFTGFLPRFFLGIFLGYLFLWSGNIWYPILAHFLNNAGTVVYYYVFNEEVTADYHEVAGAPIDWFLLVSSMVTFLVFCYLFYGKEKKLIFKRLA